MSNSICGTYLTASAATAIAVAVSRLNCVVTAAAAKFAAVLAAACA